MCCFDVYLWLENSDVLMSDVVELEPGVCSARTLINGDQAVSWVRLINVSDQSCTLKAGTVVSELKSVELVSQSQEVIEPTNDPVASMIEEVDETVPDDIRERLKVLIDKYAHIFSRNEFDLGRA